MKTVTTIKNIRLLDLDDQNINLPAFTSEMPNPYNKDFIRMSENVNNRIAECFILEI